MSLPRALQEAGKVFTEGSAPPPADKRAAMNTLGCADENERQGRESGPRARVATISPGRDPGDKKPMAAWIRSGVVDLLPEYGRALERDDPSFVQHHVFTGGRISAAAGALVLDTKFSKPADQHIFAGFEGPFDNLQKNFDGLCCILFGKTNLLIDRFNDSCFG
jgi:hypothetical protein